MNADDLIPIGTRVRVAGTDAGTVTDHWFQKPETVSYPYWVTRDGETHEHLYAHTELTPITGENAPCDACGAEATEPCRPGCLGYAIEHDGLVGTEPCS